MVSNLEHQKPNEVKVVELIEVKTTIGDGLNNNPIRVVYQYYTFAGHLLFEIDEFNQQK